ncbi:putative nucleic acid-binding Zn-ribbon protein [Peribacillus deserti]|uniref:Nucleic acid-binding Zn-ribbon protein n=1 Tax=Peribacillus deserti TaxID=673318 RepID=A0ABS2QEZ7_9BACI|nr:DUF5082 family protein [Peribacillus deserti]MBM7691605.1 putative nucleic acid-binding Zn-ribbon protein [Peribacillus deserti]
MEKNEARMHSLNSGISQLESLVRDYEEKVRRLRNSYAHISSEQGEFHANRNMVKEPILTSQTWAGRHAQSFEEIRSQMEVEYNLLSGEDTEAILSDMDAKILYFEDLISSARSRITSMHSELNLLAN